MARIVQQFDISHTPEAENVEPFMRGSPFITDLLECSLLTENESGFHVIKFTLRCNTVLS